MYFRYIEAVAVIFLHRLEFVQLMNIFKSSAYNPWNLSLTTDIHTHRSYDDTSQTVIGKNYAI